MARTRIVGRERPLAGTWSLAAAPPDVRHPRDLDAASLDWIACDGPTTVAAALRAAALWQPDRPRALDAEDWWWRCRFRIGDPGRERNIRFEGLATVADVWLNGTHVLRSDNMFVAHTVLAGALLSADNELTIRCHALEPLLKPRHPRPRWRTPLVSHQSLRWYRTSLLGRMPPWCPPTPPIGPWRPVVLQDSGLLHIDSASVRTEVDRKIGVVQVRMTVRTPQAAGVIGRIAVAGESEPLTSERTNVNGTVLTATVHVPGVARWWPHTHGRQPLHSLSASLDVAGEMSEIEFGRVGFRNLAIDRGLDGRGFGILVNGVRIFCRGVCWSPFDMFRLDASPDAYREALARLRGAGMNMVRVAGSMAYEADPFYDLCDELGILVWQDFMFANMDYPADDREFMESATIEAQQVLARLQSRPSLAVLCGNSEVAQQATMMGAAPESLANELFDSVLPQLVEAAAPGVPWVSTTPSGGALPFQPNAGVTHYYGVGAYRRPLEDARRAEVRFAAECLGFSNVPDRISLQGFFPQGLPTAFGAEWKAGVPRDAGASVDFEDVRDEYVERLFRVSATDLRAGDPERYLALGRVAVGEAMLRTCAEWRRPGSPCRGALVWFAHDLGPGAGWGIVDVAGRPKASYWYLARALAPIALIASDEGLNGLYLHAINDTGRPIVAQLRVALYSSGCRRAETGSASISIPARGAWSVHADRLFARFMDLTCAYGFGSPGHEVVAATLFDRRRDRLLASAYCFPAGLPAAIDSALVLTARARGSGDDYALQLETNRFAHAVAIEVEGFSSDDNYLHLEPGSARTVMLKQRRPGTPLRGTVHALNGSGPVTIAVEPSVER